MFIVSVRIYPPIVVRRVRIYPRFGPKGLIDKAVNTGKGANSIICMLHHYLEHHSLEESDLILHADNCSGQNKNRYMMQYLVWRVMVGLNGSISVSFLIVGHTKFAPD